MDNPDGNPQPGAESTGMAQVPVMRRAGVALLGSAIGGLVVISCEFLAAHFLKVQSYGLYASGIMVARIGEAIAVYGLPVAIFHFIPVFRKNAQREQVVGAVYAAALLPLLIGGGFAALLWFLAPWLARNVFHNVEVVPFIRILALAVPFMASTEVLGAVTRGFGHAKYYVIVKNLAAPVVLFLLLLMLVFFDGLPIWMTGAVLFAHGLAFSVAIFAVVRVAGPDLWRVQPVFGFGKLYGFSSGIMMNTFLYMVFALTGSITVAYFMDSESVGIYRMCLQVVVPFDMVLLAFHAAMGSVYPVLARENRREALEEAYGSAVRWMAIVLLPIGIALAWNRTELLALLGPGFAIGAPALLILAMGYAVFTCFGTAAYLLMLGGHKSVETSNAAIAAVMNLALCLLLVPRIGLAGAALATASSFLVLNVMRIRQVRRLFGLRTFQPYFLRLVLVSIGSSVFTLSVLQVLGVAQNDHPVALAARILIMMLLQIVLLWTIGLNQHDKGTLKTLAKPMIGRLASWRT